MLAIALAASAGLAVIRVAPVLWPPLLEYPNGDVWFSGDPRRVFANMTDRTSNDYRSKVHPLFPLTALPVLAGHRVFGVPLDRAARWYVALQGALWAAALYGLLRVARLRVPDAVLFAVLGLVSAAARFWSPVPETYVLGSITIMLALGVAAAARERKPTDARLMLVSAATLSVTVTNWMAGLLCALVTRPGRRAVQLSVNAFALVTLLWGVQKTLFPTTEFFLGDREEEHYVFRLTPERVFSVGRAFLFHSMIMPAIPGVATDGDFRIQQSSAGSASRWGLVGAAAWGGLLLLGIGAAVRTEGRSALGLISAGILAGEFGLHAVYGEETFLYSLNWLPLLVLIAGTATRTRLRPAALVLAGIVAMSGGINNARQFRAAVHSVVSRSSQRAQVLEAMARRPTDPWARGEGHVVLGFPGSQLVDKGYIEPGGSFSPRVRSFGVAIWALGPDGRPVATSDDLPLSAMRQTFVPAGDGGPPAVAIETRYYRATWALISPSKWDLQLIRTPGSPNRLAVVLRSVGPAGGPVNALEWHGEGLRVNRTWLVSAPSATCAYLGSEANPQWIAGRSAASSWSGRDGWGVARLELDGDGPHAILIDGPPPASSRPVPVAGAGAPPDVEVPDPQFAPSLAAQIDHLRMGTVGDETRPGDPVNYTFAWARDGAYIVAALARAGQVPLARDLSLQFAEHDFFGGNGAEADAPGLEIWALAEVAARLRNGDYDRLVWPHVLRKARIIEELLDTHDDIRYPLYGYATPGMWDDPDLTLVARPPRDGLIVGHMDGGWPLLYVNAVSYRGLLDAADFADRMQEHRLAGVWRARARDLQAAWMNAFRTRQSDNVRTYISALWPSGIASPNRELLAARLEQRWNQMRDSAGMFRERPLWTYFDVAEAHQWLFLDRPDRVWATLEWFWGHQASPGLYTWWEGAGEENTTFGWLALRGWVKPRYVSPHYWTAAEMLMLQLDMLAYESPAWGDRTVVIGAGIPKAWLARPIHVRRVMLRSGAVDWWWDGHMVRVSFAGPAPRVRLGAAFPAGTPLAVVAGPSAAAQ